MYLITKSDRGGDPGAWNLVQNLTRKSKTPVPLRGAADLKANASAAGPPLKFRWLQIDRLGRHLGCKVISWGLRKCFFMSGGSHLEISGLQNDVLGLVGESCEGHGAQDAHIGDLHGQNFKIL